MKIDAKVFEQQYKALCATMLMVYIKQIEANAKAEDEKILEAQKAAVVGTDEHVFFGLIHQAVDSVYLEKWSDEVAESTLHKMKAEIAFKAKKNAQSSYFSRLRWSEAELTAEEQATA
jgi:hypothetical protein